MKIFTAEAIAQHAEWMDALEDEAQIESLVDGFGDNQPLLLGFLMEMGASDYREEEQETLFFLGLEVWHLYQQAEIVLDTVTEAALAASQQDNLPLLESHDTEKPHIFAQQMQEAIEDHPMRLLLEHLSETVSEDPLIRDQHHASMLLYLKIFIDCLIGSESAHPSAH